MAGELEKRVIELLETVKKNFPERKRAVEKLMRQYGLDETLELRIQPSISVESVPTFRTGVTRPLSEGLQARFKYAGSWQMGQDIWLDPKQMNVWLKDKELLANHLARREHWIESAPMLYSDEQLALFGITEGVPQDAVYLVWPTTTSVEPEFWVYTGMDSKTFANLEAFLRWNIERE